MRDQHPSIITSLPKVLEDVFLGRSSLAALFSRMLNFIHLREQHSFLVDLPVPDTG